ncbi:MAG: hypothetical protein ACYC7F_10180, partial [Gemmatimonadaceae bacterium]
MRRAVLLGAVVASACATWGGPSRPSPSGARAVFRSAVDSMVTQPAFRNANWGILVVDPERGD